MHANKTNILLVEDEVIVAMLEKQELENIGYSVSHVTKGENAVRHALNNDTAVDVILMDINLGSGIDGTQAAEKILKQKDIPIVFLSSHTEPEVVKKTEKITSYGYVVKNSSVTVLDASIKMALKLFNEKMVRKMAEERICRSAVEWQTTFDAMENAVWLLDKDMRIVLANKATQTILKKEPKAIIGFHCWEVLHAIQQPIEACPVLRSKISRRRETMELNVGDQWFEVVVDPILDPDGGISGMVHILTDITERKRVETELHKTGMMLESLLNAIPDVIGVQDQFHNMIRYNAAGYAFLGKTKEEIAGKKCFKLIGHKTPCDICATSETYRTKNSARVEKYVPEFGVWLEVRSYPVFDAEGDILFIIEHLKDITDRKHAEEKLQKQLTEKEILLRDVHHRVKNNIANIQGLLSMQAGSTANPEVKAALQDSISRIQSMRVLYDKLLLTKEYHDLSIKSYIEGLIDSISAVFVMENKITIKKQITDFMVVSKKAIPVGIIINELLTNVFKYAFADRDQGVVSISIEKDENWVTLSIQDNGIGIDERIYLKKSSGLGLSIVKILVEQLEGTFHVIDDNGTKSIVQFKV